MPVPSYPKRWTAYEVRALMEASPTHWPRYEVVDGQLLVTPAPRLAHQRALELLREILVPYIKRHAVGILYGAPADLELEPNTIVQPDLFVIPGPNAHRIKEWNEVTSLLLAIEALSPGCERHDQVTKRPFLQRVAVPEIWLVDIDERFVERWRPGDRKPERLDAELPWRPNRTPVPLVIDLPRFFAEVLGEIP